MNWEAIIWMSLMVAFLIAEAACPIHLISIWFAAGSLVAAVASLLGGQLWLQIALFLVVSGALLALLWPVVRRFLRPSLAKTNVDAIIGSVGVVTERIDNLNASGHMKLGAMEWTARSAKGTVIEAGTKVCVDRIEGVKVYVTPVEVIVTQ